METTRGQLIRADLLVVFLIVLFLALGARLYLLQHVRHEEYLELQRKQALTVVSISPQRGTVRDRDGKPLAISIPVESVYADPRQIPDRRAAAVQLAAATGEDEALLLERLSPERHEVLIRRKLTPEQATAVRALAIPGVSFRREFKRVYPEGLLACHILGFADLEEIGREGLERTLQDDLAGKPGRHTVSRDALQHKIDTGEDVANPSTPGHDVTLTIDTTVQYFVERALDETMKEWDAASAGAVLIDVRTGDILALASRPGFDPNLYSEASDAARKNRAVTDPLEPGSTIKPLVVAASLQFGQHTLTDLIDCENGSWTEGRRTISDHHGYGRLTVKEVIAKSSNIGIGKIGLELGRERLHPWLRALRFGEASRCGLPGESSGLLHPMKDWTRDSIKSVSMGYYVLVTPLQMAAAYAALANKGLPLRPRLIRRVENPESGEIVRDYDIEVLAQKPMMTARAWQDAMSCIEEVVANGTGKKAAVPGYRVGGKTGTACKAVNGKYTNTKVATLFAAVAPISDPRIALVVVVDEPRGAPFAGTVAAPVAGAILKDVLRFLQIPPDSPSELVDRAESPK